MRKDPTKAKFERMFVADGHNQSRLSTSLRAASAEPEAGLIFLLPPAAAVGFLLRESVASTSALSPDFFRWTCFLESS